MLGMLVTNNMPWAPNTWRTWVDHVMKHKKDLGFKKALMVYTNGNPAASSSNNFCIQPTDVLRLKAHFEPGCDLETLSINGKTYIVKSRSEHQVVAFNGPKYFMINRSKSMYIVVLSETRSKVDQGAAWLRRVIEKLIEKDF